MMNKHLFFFWILVSFLFTPNFYAQKKADTLAASINYKTADSLLKKRDFNKSVLLFNEALTVYKKTGTFKKIADCYYKLGYCYEESLDYNNAQKFYEKSLKLKKEKLSTNHESISISLSGLGRLNFIQSNYKTALSFFEEALTVSLKAHKETDEVIGNKYNNIGLCYYNLGDLHTSLKYLEKSLNIDIKSLEEDHINIGFSYINIGLIYFDLMQDDKAMMYYQKSLPYFVKNDYYKGILGVYNNTGNILKSQGELNKALNYYQKSLAITLEHFKEDVSLLSLIYMNIGNTYRMLGAYDDALIYLNKSLEYYKATLDKNQDKIAKLYDNIGSLYASKGEYLTALKYSKKGINIHEKLGNHLETAYSLKLLGELKYKYEFYNEALNYNQKGLKLTQEIYGATHLLTSNFHYNIGITHYKKENYKIALKHLDSALISNSKKVNDKELFNLNNYFDHQLLLKTIYKKAQTLQLKSIQTKDNELLERSATLYYQADHVIDYIRESINNHQDKLVLAEQAKAIYADAIATHVLQYKNTAESKHLINAWHFTEKSRSNTLKDLLNDTNAKNFSNLPSELIDFEKSIKSDIAYYQSQIVAEQSENILDTDKIKNFENELFTINQKKDSLIKRLKKDYPKYYQLKHKTEAFSVKDIQDKINNRTTVLEFFSTESKIYAFTISKNDISIKELTISELDKKIERFNTSITSENLNAYKEIASILYQELIKPLDKKLIGDELIIIPDDILWYLNFDLLLTNNNNQNSRELPYLLKKYAISYSNSADLLFNPIIKNTSESKTLKECLAFSYSNASNSKKSSKKNTSLTSDIKEDLPGARKEIDMISKIIDGHYYYGANAVESTFKQNVENYSILHLALHGDVDNKNPENSKLFFTKSNDTIEDDVLYNHELFALNIPADLVVLSACNSGIGEIANGEGIMSLGNAFQYAGAKSLLLSKWEVHDKSTPELMKCFYSNLKKGMNKPKALQQAKLKYLANTEAFYTNPFYWGSFYIIGNTDAVDFKNNSDNTYYYILAFIICLSLIYLVYKKNKSKKST